MNADAHTHADTHTYIQYIHTYVSMHTLACTFIYTLNKKLCNQLGLKFCAEVAGKTLSG